MQPKRKPEPLNAFLTELSQNPTKNVGLQKIENLVIDSSSGEQAIGCGRQYAAYDRNGRKLCVFYTPATILKAEMIDRDGNVVFRQGFEEGENLEIKVLADANGNPLIAKPPLADTLRHLFEQDDECELGGSAPQPD